MLLRFIAAALLMSVSMVSWGQIDGDRTGAWYMYVWNKDLKDSRWGFQGDIQQRYWDTQFRDKEQFLLRGGVTYRPEGSRLKFTLGYAYVETGEFGRRRATFDENRLYQEVLLPQVWGRKLYVTHRLRIEQRDVENQAFRTRARYFLGLNYPLNQETLGKGAIYIALYNEYKLNGERDIRLSEGLTSRVSYYDRNRAYAALGYSVSDRSRLQFGVMHQHTQFWDKYQLQFSLVQNW